MDLKDIVDFEYLYVLWLKKEGRIEDYKESKYKSLYSYNVSFEIFNNSEILGKGNCYVDIKLNWIK